MVQLPSMPDVGTNPPAKSSVPLMALAGLISAVLVSPIWIVYLLVGPLWGLALVVYFFVYEKNRNLIGLLLFLFVSGSAFVASVGTASLLAGGGSLYGMGAAYIALPSLPFLFTAGSVGAVIVLATGVFVFGCRGLKLKTVANILLGSLGGGLLAVVAGFAGEKMPFEARSGVIDFGYSLVFLLWQPGVAGILGLTLNADRKSVQSPGAVPQHGVSGARRIAIGIAAGLCLLCVVGRQAQIGFERRQFQSQRTSEYQQYVAATPRATDISVVESAQPEQLFLPGEISGLIFCPASLKTTPRIFRQRAHGFLYEARYDYAHSNVETTPCNSWLAIVDVMDVPDAAWSSFEAQYPVDVYDPDWLFQPTVKFSQNVFMSERECYSWPSGHLAIELCYEALPPNEDLLQQFLQKYPSSAVHHAS
ncbi:hypothetical protein ACFPT7_16705 [Acidicapsa dinghuensis]|uniref:DUF4203 domain-containing protein n=1 Tax=Acidicapsa dinghuensis TaxID=2218256 RepID=A0ABW1EI20_9BACT|nr:hypothetical protein [Acidicapsa dinghuensis]